MALIALDVRSNPDSAALLQEVLDWKPTEIIMWERAVGYHKGTDDFMAEYYKRLPHEALPPISFVDGVTALRGRTSHRPAFLIDPSMQLRDDRPNHFVIPDQFVNTVHNMCVSSTEGERVEFLMFYPADFVELSVSHVTSAVIDMQLSVTRAAKTVKK